MSEYNLRKAQFLKRKAEIDRSNKENKDFKLGENKFTDWTDEEIAALLNDQQQVQMDEKANKNKKLGSQSKGVRQTYETQKGGKPKWWEQPTEPEPESVLVEPAPELTDDEYLARAEVAADTPTTLYPVDLDWRTSGALPEVQDQG